MAEGLSITFNINTNTKGLPVVVPMPMSKEEEPDEVLTEDEERGNAFDLELINKNRLEESELVDLGERIVLYARDLLQRKKVSCLRDFMDKTKDHMSGDILHLVKNEIEEGKNGFK